MLIDMVQNEAMTNVLDLGQAKTTIEFLALSYITLLDLDAAQFSHYHSLKWLYLVGVQLRTIPNLLQLPAGLRALNMMEHDE